MPVDEARPLEWSLHGLRILVVDADAIAGEALCSLLRACGARARLAGTVHDALGIHGDWRPHAVLCDLELPREDGAHLMERIRQLPGRLGRTPGLAVTDDTYPKDLERSLAAGFTGIMAKPFDLAALVIALLHMYRSDAIELS